MILACYFSNANVALKTVLDKYDALVSKGFRKEGILSMSSGIGANQAIETAANKYYAV